MKETRSTSLFDRAILSRAATDAFAKLHPARMMKNPVMFIVEVGALATTLFLVPGLAPKGLFGFQLQIVFWLWATVLFANFAEAVAEGRGKAQADALRGARRPTRSRAGSRERESPGSRKRSPRRSSARETASSWKRAGRFREMERSSRGSPP